VVTPREYRLGKRAKAMEETRRRIVEATVALHFERGIATTSMKDIASRADVGVGTVYHHFPTYDDVIRACGAHVAATYPPPSPEVFRGVELLSERVELLVRELFGYYQRYPDFERARCERDKFAVLARGVARQEAAIETVVREALRPADDDEDAVATLVALTDHAVYRSLTIAGFSTAEATSRIAEVALAWIEQRQVSARRRPKGA
jgi:AcrR family transcriptional regulator